MGKAYVDWFRGSFRLKLAQGVSTRHDTTQSIAKSPLKHEVLFIALPAGIVDGS
jgi:hypothetical protein